jgi:sec-independent protein translocase protein TatC
MIFSDKLSRNPERTLAFFETLRSALIRTGIVVLAFSVVGYYLSEPILKYVQRITGVKLVAFGIPESFFAFLILALGFGVFVSIPYILYAVLAGLPPLFPSFTRNIMLGFWLSAIVLFYTGTLFCLTISLPYGAQFLLSYENAQLEALISVKKFVSFCLLFIFGFGIIFELPLTMVLLGKIGLVKVQTLAAHRRYAILAVAIIAAVVTPTPDVFNMSLMGLPLYLLFEIGLIGMRLGKNNDPNI